METSYLTGHISVQNSSPIARTFLICALDAGINLPLSVERLILTANRIEAVPCLGDDHTALRGLKHLALSFNSLRAWSDIHSLSQWCPTMETLSLSGNPLVEGADRRRLHRLRLLTDDYFSFCRTAVRAATRNWQDVNIACVRWGNCAFVHPAIRRLCFDPTVHESN